MPDTSEAKAVARRAVDRALDRAQPVVFGPDLGTPPWADGVPNIHAYVESEIAVAGALSTMPPFDVYHPTYALPFARVALDALSKWEPTDG